MKRLSQWLAFPIALMVLIGVIFYNRHLIAQQMNHAMPRAPHNAVRPDVSVITATPETYWAKLSGYGQATSHYELTLTAQVAGQVVSLGENFETGELLQKGAVLVQMDDTQYRAGVASAESELAEARLAFLEEERQAVQASSEWAASGLAGDPDSELVLHKPQLAAAAATVKNKEAALLSAQNDLTKTKITAPFDCIVVSRDATPGGYLQAGSEVATLYSTDKIEISIALSAKDWKNLPPESKQHNWPVAITNVETDDSWTGFIDRVEQHLDTETRQRTVIISVDAPLNQPSPLLPGTFVTVALKGKETGDLYKLPGSALSQRGEIWYVNETGNLDRFSAEPLFSDAESIYIKAPDQLAMNEQHILTHPLSSYLVGMAVNPVMEDSHEQ